MKLPRADYELLREMIKKQETMSWIGRYMRNVMFVAAGGILAFLALWEDIRGLFTTQP